MPVNLSPAAGAAAQFFTNDGVPLAGGLIYTYAAGTTTPQTAYTSSTGGTAWSNPIVLNSAGRVSGGGEIWLTGNLAYKFVLYDSTSVLIATYDQIRGVGDTTELLAFEALLAGSTGSSLVGFLQSGTGAVATTVQAKLRRTVDVLDYGADSTGASSSYTAFINAVAAIPAAGGILKIPAGTYYLGNTGILFSRDNLTVIGDGMPSVASNNYSLVGGTILQGPVIFDGSNITLKDFGVDSGTTFVTARNSGNGMDGLVVHNVAQTSINKNITLQNVTGLCKIATSTADATAAVHAVLLESLQYGSGNNIVGVGGWYGIVMKVSDFNFGNLISRECDNANVYLKSETYGPVLRVNIDNIVVNNAITRGYSAVLVQANSAELHSVTVGNITVQNPTVGVNANTGTCVRIDAASTLPASVISITNITAYDGSNGIYVAGPVYALTIDNAACWSGSGVGFVTGLGTAATQPLDIIVNNLRAASYTAGAVAVASSNTRVLLGNVNAANTGGAIDGTSLISIQNNTSLGQYYGTLQVNATVPALLNGWAVNTPGQATGVIAKSGTTSLYGRINATAATNDVFMQIPPGMAPYNLAFYTAMTGFNGATNQLTPVTVFIDASGNASIYPNRAAYAATVSWFNLTDLRFPTEIPSTGAI
jgi:hypothetical protein